MTMLKEKNILFRQQFIIGPYYSDSFKSWEKYEITPELLLSSHPDLNVCHYSKDEKTLLLIGYIIDPNQPHLGDMEILEGLIRENTILEDLIKSTFDLCGNWILVYKRYDDVFFFHDCTGARSLFYTDAKKTKELWIASQPRLIANLLNHQEDTNAVEFMESQISKGSEYWWPGDSSPYSEIKALLPNHYYNTKERRKARYWPNQDLVKMSENVAIEKITKRLKGIMLGAAHRFDLALALSCGLDSRVMLAGSKDIKDKICVYNGKRPEMASNHPDVLIPRRFASKLNLDFHFIRQSKKIDDEFYKAFQLNAPFASHELVPGLQAELKHFNQQKVGVTGNILETARFFYKISNPEKYVPSGEFLADITKMKETAFASQAFENWLGSVDDTFNINIYDLFYWEQRCGRWLSNNCLVFYMAWQEVFFPFNCRSLLIDLLSVSDECRMPKDYSFFLELVRNLWPDLLTEPINPPLQRGFLQRIERKVKSMWSY